jgi:hypothetical protein
VFPVGDKVKSRHALPPLLVSLLLGCGGAAQHPISMQQFDCGSLQCRVDGEYCAREHFPTPEATRYTCRRLPTPPCGDMAAGGSCTGNAATGLFLDIVYP